MKLNDMHHVAIIASDYERSLHFYGLLGFEEEERTIRPKDIMGMLKCGDVRIELFGRPDAPIRPSAPEARGLRHLCFSVKDFDGTVSELNSLGIATEPIREFHGKRFTFFADPDGLPIELHEE